MVALLGQGAHAVAFMTVHNGSLTSARRQVDDVLGDVRLTGGIADNVGQAEVFDGSTWRPICAHRFARNDNGYEIICAMLGMSGGVFVSITDPVTAAYYVGHCTSTTVPTWPTCDTAYAGGNCAVGGGNPGVEIQCTTPSPTPSPTQAGPDGGAAAVGDPHLQNVHGERFDLMKEGKHVLISIPRGQDAQHALLRVQADARRLGGNCADLYFKEVNVTGAWAEAKNAGGYHYSVSQNDIEAPEWVAFGKVELKVVHGRTDGGLPYLNVYMKHLRSAGVAVGGLLGEDDHEDVITPPEACTRKMALGKGQLSGQIRASASSVAMATFGE